MLVGLIAPARSHAQNGIEALRQQLHAVVDTSKAHIGFAVMGIDFKDSLFINGHDHFPMQSVYKFPLAICILGKVDKGELKLDQTIHMSRAELDQETWSPMVDERPNQDINMSLRELLGYTVSKSDNNGCDALFRLAGGTKVVNDYIHSIGIEGIAIVATEAEMHKDWNAQYTNWCEPAAMAQLLRGFYNGKVLSKSSRDLLMGMMTNSVNDIRIKGQLPRKVKVAHKTGTSGMNEKGLSGATNDVGIVTLPDGRHVAIVAYVSDYRGDVAWGEHMIATLAKITWDHYAGKK